MSSQLVGSGLNIQTIKGFGSYGSFALLYCKLWWAICRVLVVEGHLVSGLCFHIKRWKHWLLQHLLQAARRQHDWRIIHRTPYYSHVHEALHLFLEKLDDMHHGPHSHPQCFTSAFWDSGWPASSICTFSDSFTQYYSCTWREWISGDSQWLIFCTQPKFLLFLVHYFFLKMFSCW